MKLSLHWLSDFLTWKEKNIHALTDRVTLSIAEIEEVEEQGKLLEHCCVGKVLKIERHPNADRLSLVEVDTDREKKRVVCGGTNLREGMLVAFAHIGATVRWHGEEMMTLEPVKIRGEASEGMICAAEELDLAHRFPAKGEHDIIDLAARVHEPELRVGMSLRDVLGTDTILHISNTAITHRPDLFSHIGFAREFVAAGLAIWKGKKEPTPRLPKAPKTPLPFNFHVDIKQLVPRYCACLIEVDSIGETPSWMRQRLEATGWRTLNLPIDITNYVTMEMGMPLHCFDADDIRGDIHFRLSQKGEMITTLDGVDRPLPDDVIVLSDDKGIFDLMGIMGGLRSSTKDGSRRLYLHAAAVDPTFIRRTILEIGHRTEAATIYEKGIPAVTVERGFTRALELFLSLVPGAKLSSRIDTWGTNGKPKAITVPMDRLTGTLGTAITAKQASGILQSLGCTVRSTKKALTVTPPPHRARDLTMDMDIIEEVARLSGYDRIDPMLPIAPVRIPARDARLHRVRDALKEERFTEIVPLSLVSPELLRRAGFDPSAAIGPERPLAEDTSVLQTSTLPALLEHAQRNILNATTAAGVHEPRLRSFHIAHVFGKNIPEHAECSILLASLRDTGMNDDPFLLLKQSLGSTLAASGYALSIAPLPSPGLSMHPGRAAALAVNGQSIGAIFEVHPTVRARFDLRHRAAATTVDLDFLFSLAPAPRLATPLPHFPAVAYDVTLTRSHAEPFGKLIAKLRGSHPLLESVGVHDLYAGKPLALHQYNVTLRCTYRSPERTLTEEEAKAAHEKVMALVVRG